MWSWTCCRIPACRKGQTPPPTTFICSVTSITSIAGTSLRRSGQRIRRTAFSSLLKACSPWTRILRIWLDSSRFATSSTRHWSLTLRTTWVAWARTAADTSASMGKVDIVMGSFSKTFASNGGFVACKSRAVKEYLRFYSAPATFSNALSPVQAATILKAFHIVDSVEGRVQRLALMANVLSLRHQLREAGLDYYGDPSAIVCVKMGTEGLARLVSKRLPELGLIANLVEFPAVPKGAARIRMQVMASHSEKNIADAVQILKTARQQAELEFKDITQPAQRAVA